MSAARKKTKEFRKAAQPVRRGRPSGDHDARKAEIAEALLTVFREHGFEAVTMREVARAAGYTTGVLSHYFRDKDDLLNFSITYVFQLHASEWVGVVEKMRPLEALREICARILPTTDRARLDWTLWLNYQARARWQPSYSAAIHARAQLNRNTVGGLLKAAIADGSISPKLDLAEATDLIVAFVEGLGVGASQNEARLSKARQLRLLDLFLERLLGTPTKTAS